MQSPRIEVALLPDDNGDINTPSSLFDIWMILHVPDDKNPEGIRVDGGPYDRNDALQKLSEIWMEVGKRNSPKLHSGGSGIGALSSETPDPFCLRNRDIDVYDYYRAHAITDLGEMFRLAFKCATFRRPHDVSSELGGSPNGPLWPEPPIPKSPARGCGGLTELGPMRGSSLLRTSRPLFPPRVTI